MTIVSAGMPKNVTVNISAQDNRYFMYCHVYLLGDYVLEKQQQKVILECDTFNSLHCKVVKLH